MNTQNRKPVSIAVILFVALAIAFAVLIHVAAGLSNPFDQAVMVSAGSAILASGLTFFLIRMFQIKEK